MIDHRINQHLTIALALGVGGQRQRSRRRGADGATGLELKVVDQSGAAIQVPIRIKHGL